MQPTPMAETSRSRSFLFCIFAFLARVPSRAIYEPRRKELFVVFDYGSALEFPPVTGWGKNVTFRRSRPAKEGMPNSTRQSERVTGTVAKEPTRRDFSTSKAAQATHWTVGRGCGKVGPGQVDTSLFLREPYAPQTHIKQDSPRSRQVSRHRSPSDSLPRNARRRPALPPTCVPSRASVRTLV